MATKKSFLKAFEAFQKAEVVMAAKKDALAIMASDVLGYEVVADLVNEADIEFRRVLPDGSIDSFDLVRIEDVLSKLNK